MEKPITAAMLSLSGTKMTSDEKKLFEKVNPLGISIFARNIENRHQLTALSHEVKEVIGRENVLIAVDQEGGRVRRLREPEFRAYEAQSVLGKIAAKFDEDTAERIVRTHATLISDDLHQCGINWNYAPVLDIAFENTAPVIKSRCFGNDEKKIAVYGRIIVEEYINNAILPCIKHLPGHGRAVTDPHLELPVLDNSLEELALDFYPFEKLNDAPAGMTAHIMIPQVDNQAPITQSAKGIKEIIRGIIGFDGFLISDSIDMHALRGRIGERTSRALEAGCDAVCYCGGKIDEMCEVASSCHFLTDKAMIRFAKIEKIINNKRKTVNIDKLTADYNQILGYIEKYDDAYDYTEVLNKMTEMLKEEKKHV